MAKAADYKISGIRVFLFVFFFFSMLFLGCSILAGFITLSYNGFAYDKEGNLYLGKSGRVEVTDTEGTVIRTFRAKGTINFNFTISGDEIIMVARNDLYWMDLSGNVLEEELNSKRWQEFFPRGSETIFVDEDGTTYTMELSGFFRTCIFKWNGDQKEVVFKMPLLDYFGRLMFVVTCFGFIVVVSNALELVGEYEPVVQTVHSRWDSHKL